MYQQTACGMSAAPHNVACVHCDKDRTELAPTNVQLLHIQKKLEKHWDIPKTMGLSHGLMTGMMWGYPHALGNLHWKN